MLKCFTCQECKLESDTVRLCILDGYDAIRATFPLPLADEHREVICGMEDRGGGELYRVALCRTCRSKANKPID